MDTLDINDKYLLSAWSRFHEKKISDRAKLVLMANDGIAISKIAQELKLPKVQVLKGIDRFNKLGIASLVDAPRPGRPRKIVKLRAIHRFLENLRKSDVKRESIESFSKRIGLSSDTVWRAARMVGVTIERNTFPYINVEVTRAGASDGLIGLFLSSTLLIAAFQEDEPWLVDQLPLAGKWLHPPQTVISKADKINPLSLSLNNALRICSSLSDEQPSKLAFNVCWKRWINSLVYSEPEVSKSIRLIIGGVVTDPYIFKMLQLTHPFKAYTHTANKIGDVGIELKLSIAHSPAYWLETIRTKLTSPFGDELIKMMATWCTSVREPSSGFFVWYREPRLNAQ